MTLFRFAFIIFILIGFNSNAQYIQGRVIEISNLGEEIPIAEAKVYWQGTTISTITDLKGRFSIQDTSLILSASFIGYQIDSQMIVNNQYIFILESLLDLDEVVIKEKRATTQYSLLETVNLQTLNNTELEKAACCNLSECFETNSTVDVAYTDAVSGSKKIRMLGLDGKYVKFTGESMPLIEGISSSFGINYIPGSWIESIQIIKGTGSVLNGYSALTGQINVEYFKPENSDRLFWNAFINSEEKYENNLMFAKKKGDWTSNLFTHISYHDKELDHNEDSFLDAPYIRNIHILNRWKYNGNDKYRMQFFIRGLHEIRESGQTSKIINPYLVKIENQLTSFSGKLAFLLPNNEKESIGLQYSLSYHTQDAEYGSTEYGLNKINQLDESVYFNAIHQLYNQKLDHTTKYGLSYDARRLEERLTGFNLNESLTHDNMDIITGLFFEYSTSSENAFHILTGYRIDYHNEHGLFHSPRINLKYNPDDKTAIRFISGKSFRIPYVLAENQTFFISSRDINTQNLNDLLPEEGWNLGVNISYCFYLFGKESSLNSDFYRTIFTNQIVVDIEDEDKISFYNLDGKAYSNVWQIDFSQEILKNLQFKCAVKLNDVQSTFITEIIEEDVVYEQATQKKVPLVPKSRGLININYTNNSEKWMFDITANYIGKSRIPYHSELTLGIPKESPSFYTMNTQVTRKFNYFDVYVGGENLLNYTQKTPILDVNEGEIGQNFDASLIWAPVMGRVLYLGVRYRY